jgi:acetyl-CoA acetyltransferase
VNKQWVKEFFLYTTKVYSLDKTVKRAANQRRFRGVKPFVNFMILLVGFVLRLESMEAFDREIRKGAIQDLIPRKNRKPSNDTLRDGDIVIRDPAYGLRYFGYNLVSADASEVALEYGVTRQDQDKWALRSQQIWLLACEQKKFNDEIIGMRITEKSGEEKVFNMMNFPSLIRL